MSLSGKRILLGVTGGIAAYKAANLLRLFQKEGAEVRVAMTPSATQFIGTDTFSALSRQPVAVEIFEESQQSGTDWVKHVHWAEWADIYVIAPATANTIAKLAGGFCDNMVTTLALAARCPLMICPTMDGGMYENSATQANLELLKERGLTIFEPASGYLASGLEDKGRLPEPEEILEAVRDALSSSTTGFLKGKNVVVTAGPTREYIDAVRYISNPSSGKMGFALAEAASEAGANVTLIHGPVALSASNDIETQEITSAEELFEAIKKQQDADVVIMAAAVSDFAPAERVAHKVKKDQASDSIPLKRNPDILAWLGERKKEYQTLIGFAMETEELKKNAGKKLTSKKLDWIAANQIGKGDSGFAVDSNIVTLLSTDDEKTFSGSKKEVAQNMLSYIFGTD